MKKNSLGCWPLFGASPFEKNVKKPLILAIFFSDFRSLCELSLRVCRKKFGCRNDLSSFSIISWLTDLGLEAAKSWNLVRCLHAHNELKVKAWKKVHFGRTMYSHRTVCLKGKNQRFFEKKIEWRVPD